MPCIVRWPQIECRIMHACVEQGDMLNFPSPCGLRRKRKKKKTERGCTFHGPFCDIVFFINNNVCEVLAMWKKRIFIKCNYLNV